MRHACSLQKAQLAVFQKMQQAGFNQDVHSAGRAAAAGPERASDIVTDAAVPDLSAGGALPGGIGGRDAGDISATSKARSSGAAAPLSSGSGVRGSAVEAGSVSGGNTSVAGGTASAGSSALSADPLQQSSGGSADDRGGVSGAGPADAGASARDNGHQTSDDIIQQGIAKGLIRRHGGAGDADISKRAGSSSGSSSSGVGGGAVDELGTGGDADEDFADKLLARATAAGELFAAGGGAASGSTADGSERSGGSAGSRAGAVEDLPAAGHSSSGNLSRREADSNGDPVARAALPESVADSAAAKQQPAARQQAGQQEQPRQQHLDAASSRAGADTNTAGSAVSGGGGTTAAHGSGIGGDRQNAEAGLVSVNDSSHDSSAAADAAIHRQMDGSSGSSGSSLALGTGPSAELSGVWFIATLVPHAVQQLPWPAPNCIGISLHV